MASGRPPTETALRERRLRDRERATEPRFVCARCGVEFTVGEADAEVLARRRRRGRRTAPVGPYVLIGGRPWCERCAAERFRKRPDPDCAIGANAIEHLSHCKRAHVESPH